MISDDIRLEVCPRFAGPPVWKAVRCLVVLRASMSGVRREVEIRVPDLAGTGCITGGWYPEGSEVWKRLRDLVGRDEFVAHIYALVAELNRVVGCLRRGERTTPLEPRRRAEDTPGVNLGADVKVIQSPTRGVVPLIKPSAADPRTGSTPGRPAGPVSADTEGPGEILVSSTPTPEATYFVFGDLNIYTGMPTP
jgi:hypothetical protein